MTKVLVVGLMPSAVSPDNSAFHPQTGSRKRVDSWFEGTGWHIEFINVLNDKTVTNVSAALRKVDTVLFKAQIEEYKACGFAVVTVGLKVRDLFERSHISEYFSMPHPSGKSRIWNDRGASVRLVNALHRYLYMFHGQDARYGTLRLMYHLHLVDQYGGGLKIPNQIPTVPIKYRRADVAL